MLASAEFPLDERQQKRLAKRVAFAGELRLLLLVGLAVCVNSCRCHDSQFCGRPHDRGGRLAVGSQNVAGCWNSAHFLKPHIYKSSASSNGRYRVLRCCTPYRCELLARPRSCTSTVNDPRNQASKAASRTHPPSGSQYSRSGRKPAHSIPFPPARGKSLSFRPNAFSLPHGLPEHPHAATRQPVKSSPCRH